MICVFAPPSVTSRERNALTGVGVGGGGVGVGVGEGEADGDADGEADGDGEVWLGVGVGLGVVATNRNHRGKVTKTRGKRMKRGNDSRGWLVTPGARESTRGKSARGTANGARGRRVGASSRRGPPAH